MKTTIFLEDIADKLEETMECWEQYLNIVTGEFVSLSDGSYIETDEELAEEIDFSNDYVRLPNQYEINEYKIMRAFADASPDGKKREKLYRVLDEKKPFRRFKDEINYLGLDDAYYAFRFLSFIKIAKEWCEENDIPHKTRDK